MQARRTSQRHWRIMHMTSIVIGISMLTSGCAPTGKDLFAQAMKINTTAKDAVAELQMYIYDDDWNVNVYGEIPDACGADGFSFRFGRGTPAVDGWRLPQGSVRAQTDDLMGWLDQHGWTDIALLTYSGDVTDVIVTARNADAYVDDVSITLLPGKHTDAVSIDATTTCEPGNVDDLADLMFPDGLSDYTEPESEHPSAEPFFGMSVLSPTPGPRPDPITYPDPTATPSPSPTP